MSAVCVWGADWADGRCKGVGLGGARPDGLMVGTCAVLASAVR